MSQHQKKIGRPRKNHIEEEQQVKEDKIESPQKCGSCKIDVPDDCAILCDGWCGEWYHLECVNLDNDDYISINDLAEKVKWFCHDCNSKLENILKSGEFYKQDRELNQLRLTVETLLTTVKGVINDKIRLNEKMDKLIESDRPSMNQTSLARPVISEEVVPSWSSINKNPGRGRGRGFSLTSAVNSIRKQPLKDALLDFSDATEKRVSNVASYSVGHVDRGRNERRHNRMEAISKSPRPTTGGGKEISSKFSNDRNSRAWPSSKNVVYGKSSNSKIKSVVVKPIRKKAIFVSRLCPEVVAVSIEDFVKGELNLDYIKCSQLKTKFDSYSSFHIEVNESDYDKVMSGELWPEGSLITPFRGTLKKDYVINRNRRSSPEHFLSQENGHHPLDPTSELERETDFNRSFHSSA